MSENKLFDNATKFEQLSDVPADVTPEQSSEDTASIILSDGALTTVSEQVGEKKLRRKRIKKSEDTDIVADAVKPESDDFSNTESESSKSNTKDFKEVTVDKQYKTGDPVDIRLALLYRSSVAPKHFKGIRGRYYVWDGTAVNGRIRLTDSPSGVGKPERVIGWVKVKNIL